MHSAYLNLKGNISQAVLNRYYIVQLIYFSQYGAEIELVSKELNHLAAILHVYAGGLNFMNFFFSLLFFKKKMEILLHFLSFL